MDKYGKLYRNKKIGYEKMIDECNNCLVSPRYKNYVCTECKKLENNVLRKELKN